MKKIQNIALIGGTHGNEFSGIYLLKKWSEKKTLQLWDTLNITSRIANPRACEHSVRYMEMDLNREFGNDDLDNMEKIGYESLLAKKINLEFGPKGHSSFDLIIDLHNTTSNMGACLMLLRKDTFNLKLGAYVKSRMTQAHIYFQDNIPIENKNFLITVAQQGVTVEVGAQPNSVLQHETLELMEIMTKHILDFVTSYNAGVKFDLPEKYEAFQYADDLFLPVDENGCREALVSKSISHRDFKPIEPGQIVMETFLGETIAWQGNYTAYPLFINEAAYHKNHKAMTISKKIIIATPLEFKQ